MEELRRRQLFSASRRRRMILSAFLTLLLLATTKTAKGEVIELSDSTFEHQTQSSTGQTTGKWFVAFTAPWCGHCKRLEPIWSEFAEKLASDNAEEDDDPSPSSVLVAKVDMTDNASLRERFSIRGFPTILFFANRQMYEYKGERSVEAFMDFATKGYLTAAEGGKKVPLPISWFDQTMKNIRVKAASSNLMKNLVEDMEHIVQMRKNAALVLMVVSGLLGMIVGCITSPRRGGAGGITSASSGLATKSKSE